MSDRPQPPIPPYLRGDRYALRAFVRDDAEHAAVWWPEPYPVNAAEAIRWFEDTLKESWFSNSSQLAIVPAAGGAPIGYAEVSRWRDFHGGVKLAVSPLLPAADRRAAVADAIRLLAGWFLDELDYLNGEFVVPADLVPAELPAGLRRVGVLREGLAAPSPGRPGGRQDQVVLEALNAAWAHAFAPEAPPPAGRPAERIDLAPEARPESLKNPAAIGPRVYLRPLEEADAQVTANWYNEEPETGFDLGRRPLSPVSHEVRTRQQYKQRPPEEVVLGVCRIDDGGLIGVVGTDTIDWVHRTGETFSFFGADARNRGFGSEAKALLLGYCFERLGLHMLRSTVFSINPRSAAALLKQGYRHVGTIRAPIFRGGRIHQDWLFDVLGSDWLALRSG